MGEERARQAVARYKPDISLGNILTVIGMTMGVVIWGLRLEGRVDAQAQIIYLQQQNNELRFSHLESTMNQQKQDFEKTLASIERGLQRIEDKLDGKADK